MINLRLMEGFSVKSSLPISLFPAVPFLGQIEVLSKSIKSLIEEKKATNFSSLNIIVKKFREGKYSEIFSQEFKIKKTKLIYYEKASLGLLHLTCSADEVFTKESQTVLKLIKEKLDSSQLKWVFVITSDDTIVFSKSYNHFLSWSTLLRSHSAELICLSLMNPSILDLIDNEYRKETYRKCLHKIKQLFRLENSNESHAKISQELLKFESHETSHNYLKSYFESLLQQGPNFSSKEGLNDILTALEKHTSSETEDKIRIIDLLDISPINLLEITPFMMNEKLRGQFYTPLELTIPLIINGFHHKTLIEDLSELKILDPACGPGILLVVALEFIVNQLITENSYKSFLSLRKIVFHSNITGMDIDERLVYYCRSFFALFIKSKSIMTESNTPIVHKNFLEESVYNYTKSPLTIQKYDFILSNPPYIPLHSRFMKNILSDTLRKELQDMIPNFMGKRDNLYIMFLGLALEYFTKPNRGTVSFIIDSSFLDLPSYKLIRKRLLSKYNLNYILSQYKYDRAVVDLSIVTFENSESKNDVFFWQKSITQSRIRRRSADFLEQPNYSYKIQLNPKVSKIIRSIKDRSILLDGICNISCGLEYGSMLKTHFLSPVKDSDDYYKVIDGANGLPQSYVLFWVPNWRNSYVRVSKEFENHLKQNQLNRSSKANKKVLLISGNKNRFVEPKIIIRQTASRFIATYDEKGYFGLRNLHIIHSFNEQYSPLLILGILSSKLGTSLGKALNIIRGSINSTNRYPQIRVGDLKRFPIIDISKCTKFQLENMKKLEELVLKNLNYGKVLAEIYHNIWNNFLVVAGSIPVSSQKRFIQLLDSSKKLNFVSKEVLNEITPLLNEIRKQQQLIAQNQAKIDRKVVTLYNLTKEDWNELKQETDC
ncbi:MAG: Eco57I restriction-modification methylase domain-containing protein [Candidatus Hodarchaeales archaeon]